MTHSRYPQISVKFISNESPKQTSFPSPHKDIRMTELRGWPTLYKGTQIPARRSLEKHTGERTRVWGGTKHRILRITLNRKPASQKGNPLPRTSSCDCFIYSFIHLMSLSLSCRTLSKALVHRVFPLVTFVGAWLNQVWEQAGFPDDRELPAMHHPAWTLSSFSKISSPRFVSRFFVLKTIQTEIQYSWGLALSQASQGKCHCLSEPVMWVRDWIQELFLSVFYRDFFYCCKLSSLWIDQVSLSPREKFTAG